MADFCKKCEIEMFGQTYLNLPDDDIILCEGCGGYTCYGEIICKECRQIVKSEIYPDTGLEHFCKCQGTLDANFDGEKWVSERNSNG